jgi:hypothetical protein
MWRSDVCYRKASREVVRRHRMRMIRVGRAAGVPSPLGLEARRTHQPFHALAPAPYAVFLKFSMHTWATIRTPAAPVNSADFELKSLIV